jgi:molybdopterin synthase sulfur carrier subunit
VRIEVRYFASLAERAGLRAETLEVGPLDDVTALWERVIERHPALGALAFRPSVVCDRAWADWQTRLEGVREVAFLPPVSGG